MVDVKSTIIAINSPIFPGLDKNVNIRKELGDEAIFRQIFIEGELDLRKSKFWENIKSREAILGDKALIVDCGAHIGLASLFYGLLFPKAKIISVEPDYNNYLLACANNAENKNVTLKNFAIASTRGTLFIENPAESSAAYRLSDKTKDNLSQGVPSVSINEMLSEFNELTPFIIKIDIEGWEKDLFSKNTEWIELFDYLVIELHDWMLPGEEISQNFWRSLKDRDFDIDSIGEHVIIKTHGCRAIECNSVLDVMEKIYRSNSILTGWYGELQKGPLFKKIEFLDGELKNISYEMDVNNQKKSHLRETDWFKEQFSLIQKQNSELTTSLLAQTRETHWFKEQFFLIQHSRSWRWTMPLRALANVARRRVSKSGTPLIAPTSEDGTSQSTAPLVQLSPPQKTRPRPMVLPKNVAPATTGLRILIVTPDIVGPIRNGGIGTAFTALALFAARAGSRVSILYTLGSHSEHWSITDCVDWYAHGGVSFIPLRSDGDAPNIDAPWPRRNAYGVYTWLKAHGENYDLIIFPEWHGDAYYAVVGRHQGLMLQHAQIWVNTHGPSVWSMEGNYQLPTEVDLIDLDFMERETVRLADGVVSPSAYLLNWMRDHQWQLPKQALTIQNLMEEEGFINEAAHPDVNAINELIFFGRLEPRKGLIIFCDAVDRLIPIGRDQLQMITFMGKALPVDSFDSIAYIEKRSVAWGVPITIQTEYGRDQALAYLSESPSRLAIIASLVENLPYTVLECLHHGIRFIASEIGGIPELVDHADHTRVLFPPRPSALARLLESAITEGIAPAHRAQMPEQVEAQWQMLLAQITESLKEKPAAPAIPLEQVPLVSICMPHHNSHDTLHSALDSIRQQTYSHYEVIVVDDGSSDKKSLDALMALEKEFAEKGWMLIRQENAYPGAARNRAVDAAKGEYLLFMDDDNLAMPHELETFVAVAKHTGADILTTVSAVFTGNMPPKHPKHLWLPLGAATGAGVYRNIFGDMNSLWKKTAFHTVGGFTEDYGLGHEDWEIFAKATLMGSHLELVPEPLFWYRATANGVQTSGDMAAYIARSVRPYLQYDPHGLGTMAAYAAWARFSAAPEMTGSRLQKRTPWRTLFSFVRRQDLIIKFRITTKRYGLKIAVLKTIQYIRSHAE